MPGCQSSLAINGGEKAFAVDLKEFSQHPVMEREEIAAVVELMARNEVSTSPLVRQFEKEYADYFGMRYAIAQNNGTSTLHSAYFAVGIGPGDEVITPAYTWHLGVEPIMAAHGIPIFADVDPRSLCLIPEDVERKITDRTKAISVLHAYGHPAPMDEIMAIARKHHLAVIEDCSHAHGSTYKGRFIGTIGDIGCFSLQGTKIIVAGEGGVMVTNNQEYYERVTALAHYERIPELSESYAKYGYNYPQPPACFGFKYRIHPLAAAIAQQQFRKLDRFIAIERENMRYITKELTGLHPAFEPAYESPDVERVWLNYIGNFDSEKAGGVSRDRFVEALRAEGIDATAGRAGYLPLYWNPLYQEKNLWGKGCPFSCPFYGKEVNYEKGLCPNTELIWQQTVGLPVFWNRTPREVLDQLIAAVGKVLANLEQLK